jgi:hypothetical protein
MQIDPEIRREFTEILERQQQAEPGIEYLFDELCAGDGNGPVTVRMTMFEFALWLEGELTREEIS